MNYFESSEYKDAKCQLRDEYKICYDKIETYIQLASIYGLHKEACLIQILDDFLSAQAEGKELSKVTGPDYRKYCDTMIQAERSRNRSKYEVMAYIAVIPLTVMLLSLFTSILRNDDKLSSITNQIIIGGFSIAFPVIYLIYYLIRQKTAKVLFNHVRASKAVITIVSVIFYGLIYLISAVLDRALNIAIPVPFPAFLIIIALSLVLLTVLVIIEKKDNKQLRIVPESEETAIEQVICPACGNEYDMDYPKCPYCKN
jgi:DNA-binding ferritin-like protein (Dps family)